MKLYCKNTACGKENHYCYNRVVNDAVKEERLIWRAAIEYSFDEPEFIEAVLMNVQRERVRLENAKTSTKEVATSGTDTALA